MFLPATRRVHPACDVLERAYWANDENSVYEQQEMMNQIIAERTYSLQSWRARCLVALVAGATIERVGDKSTVFKMKIDIFRKLLTFLPLYLA